MKNAWRPCIIVRRGDPCGRPHDCPHAARCRHGRGDPCGRPHGCPHAARRRHGRGDPCGRPHGGGTYPRVRATARVAPTVARTAARTTQPARSPAQRNPHGRPHADVRRHGRADVRRRSTPPEAASVKIRVHPWLKHIARRYPCPAVVKTYRKAISVSGR